MEPLPLEQYRGLLEAAPTLIWRAGLDSKCDYFNGTWLAFRGRTLREELGDGWVEGVHADDRDRCIETYRACFAQRAPFELEYRLRRHDGAYRWILDRGTPFSEDGRFAGYIGHCIDVHDRRTADEGKATFLAMLAHELRTPLQSLVLFTDVARQATEAGEVLPASAVARLDRQVEKLRRLVVQASSGIDAAMSQPLELEPGEVDLGALARGAVSARALGSTRVALEVRVEGAARLVWADGARLVEALEILLDNAIKFSPEAGRVTVVVRTDLPWASIEVLDEGPGVPPSELHRVGAPFFRASNASPLAYPGLGLGLAIAKRIAAAHSGRLELTAREGGGTRATITLPSGGS